jgi:protein-arginine kinase activator protein McsA
MICDQCGEENAEIKHFVKKFEDINLCESCAEELGIPWEAGGSVDGETVADGNESGDSD